MAIAYDAFSRPGAGTGVSGDQSWTHTPVGTPRAIVVWVLFGTSAAGGDVVTGVTYNGVAMTEVTGSPVVKTSAEAMQAHCFVLLSSVPSGAQTVAVDVTIADPYSAGAISYTADADCEVIDSDGTINSSSIADPSVTLSLGGRTCASAIGFVSGQNAVTGITPLASWTSRSEEDVGGQTQGIYTYDTIGTADVTAGWTQTAEDAVMVALALSEVEGAATGQPTVKRFGGVPHMPANHLRGGHRGGVWGRTRDGIYVPQRRAA